MTMDRTEMFAYPLPDPVEPATPVLHMRVDLDDSDPDSARFAVEFAARLTSVGMTDALALALSGAMRDLADYLAGRRAELVAMAAEAN